MSDSVEKMDTPKTYIRESILERICQAVPRHRDFWQNFFISCRPYDLETNWANYRSDVRRLQSQDPSVSFDMMQAVFYLVTDDKPVR